MRIRTRVRARTRADPVGEGISGAIFARCVLSMVSRLDRWISWNILTFS